METCCKCGIPFYMPTYHQKRLLANKGEIFYCPSGHPQHYTGKTEAQKLTEQLEKERNENATREEELLNKFLDEKSKALKL